MKERTDRREFLTTAGLAAGAALLPGYSTGRDKDRNHLSEFSKQSDISITDVKTYAIKRAVLVKLETNAGVTGWGESSPNSTRVIEAFIHDKLKHYVIGKSPFDMEPLWDAMFWGEHDLGPAGALPYAIAGIDLALWDIVGKIMEQPVYKLLGGAYRKEIPAYGGIPLRGGTIPPEEARDRALKLVDLGFKVIKLRMQIRENNLDPVPDPTLRFYETVRGALPGHVELFVDPNEGYTASRAIEIGRALQKMGMKYFESPCPLENHRDTAEVVRALDIPVMAGEKCYTRWQIRDLIVEANPDIIQPDVIKAGGITELQKISVLGQAFFKKMALHNTKPTLGTAAALHIVASSSNAGPFLEFVELDTYGEVLSVCKNAIQFVDGMMRVPEGPGLGLEIDEERLEALAR